MTKLAGLKKTDREQAERELAVSEFISAAKVKASTKGSIPRAQGATFKRVTFSLSEPVSEAIDRLTLVPRTFRVSRSDIVRAGVAALTDMPEDALIALLERVREGSDAG